MRIAGPGVGQTAVPSSWKNRRRGRTGRLRALTAEAEVDRLAYSPHLAIVELGEASSDACVRARNPQPWQARIPIRSRVPSMVLDTV